jgi:hypothetical protein
MRSLLLAVMLVFGASTYANAQSSPLSGTWTMTTAEGAHSTWRFTVTISVSGTKVEGRGVSSFVGGGQWLFSLDETASGATMSARLETAGGQRFLKLASPTTLRIELPVPTTPVSTLTGRISFDSGAKWGVIILQRS